MDSKTLLVEAVRARAELPASLREHVTEVTAVEEHQFDKSYIEFLDEQIRLSPRGPEWTERLRHRRAALSPFCDVTLVRGRVPAVDRDFRVEVHPETRAVIHWEEYEIDVDA
jgi:hypothetical protein